MYVLKCECILRVSVSKAEYLVIRSAKENV